MRLLFVLLLIGCSTGGGQATVNVSADGPRIRIDGDRALRAIVLELAWGDDLAVAGIRRGEDAAGLSLLETDWEPGKRSARIVLADGRGVKLPARGELIVLDAVGAGAVRIVRVEGADDGPSRVLVEVAP